MAVIRITEAGLSLGVQIDGTMSYHLRENMSVDAEGHIVSIYDDGNLIVSGETTEYYEPKEASVADLLPQIQLLIDTIFIDGLTADEIEAIQNANNPNATNPFATINDLGSANSSIVSFASGGTKHVSFNTGTYSSLAHIVFAGTDIVGTISNIYINAWRVGGAGGAYISIRVVNLENGLTVAELTNITSTNEFNIQDMGAISNLPTTRSVFEIQGLRFSGATGYIGGLELFY